MRFQTLFALLSVAHGTIVRYGTPVPFFLPGTKPWPSPPSLAQLPTAWDWRRPPLPYAATSHVTAIRNQFLPRWCGSCWAQAVTSALSDRLKILQIKHGVHMADIDLSPQPLLDCGLSNDSQGPNVGSCAGGDDLLSYEWARVHGLTDTTCSPYRAGDGSCLNGHSACTMCHSDGTCLPVNGTRYHVEEHGGFHPTAAGSNATGMMQEVMARGPISCSMYDDIETFKCYKGGVLDPPLTNHSTTHVVSILGWGEEPPQRAGAKALPYWIARHSGGTQWGEGGFFRIRRGANALRIEEFCYWGTLKGVPGQKGQAHTCTD